MCVCWKKVTGKKSSHAKVSIWKQTKPILCKLNFSVKQLLIQWWQLQWHHLHNFNYNCKFLFYKTQWVIKKWMKTIFLSLILSWNKRSQTYTSGPKIIIKCKTKILEELIKFIFYFAQSLFFIFQKAKVEKCCLWKVLWIPKKLNKEQK